MKKLLLLTLVLISPCFAQSEKDEEILRLKEKVVELETRLELSDKGEYSRELIDIEQLIQSKKLLERQQRKLAEEVSKQKDKVKALEREIKNKDERYDELVTDTDSKDVTIRNLKEAVVKLREEAVGKCEAQPVRPAEKVQPGSVEEATFARLQGRVQALTQKVKEYASVESDNAYLRGEMEKLRRENSELVSANQGTQKLMNRIKELEGKLADMDQNVELIQSLREENTSLKQDLELAREEVSAVRELSTIKIPARVQEQPREEEVEMMEQESIVEVIVAKANLRAGPSLSDSIVLQVPEGSRLLVEARKGEWYRIVSPQGGRAFIQEELVRSIENKPEPRAETAQAEAEPKVTEVQNLEDQLFNALKNQLGD